MNNTIVCRATPDLGSKWLLVTGGSGAWSVEDAYGNLQAAIEAVMATPLLFPGDPAPVPRKAPSRLSRDVSFSTRALEDAIASYAAEPDELSNLGRNALTTILCPEGGGVENRWATLHRVPQTGSLVATGFEGRFRPQLLAERILEWFVKQQWRSFTTPKVAEKHEPRHMQPDRPAHTRELLIRHNWSAREVAPDAFGPLNLGRVVTPAMEAWRISRTPRAKREALREHRKAEGVRLRAEAEERAKQREAAAR